VIEWFSRFVDEIESRDDTYLADPRIPGVSVKIRGGALLEIKVAGRQPAGQRIAEHQSGGRLDSPPL
jgi:hypothetical protein